MSTGQTVKPPTSQNKGHNGYGPAWYYYGPYGNGACRRVGFTEYIQAHYIYQCSSFILLDYTPIFYSQPYSPISSSLYPGYCVNTSFKKGMNQQTLRVAPGWDHWSVASLVPQPTLGAGSNRFEPPPTTLLLYHLYPPPVFR